MGTEAAATHRRVIAEAAKKWSTARHDSAKEVSCKMMRSPLAPSLSKMPVGQSGWAIKQSLPSVTFPTPMKRLLLQCFNEPVRVTPETALKRLQCRPEHTNAALVECVVTAGRIKWVYAVS